jgi:hypothetical protein
MPDQAEPGARQTREQARTAARNKAAQAVHEMVHESGGRTVAQLRSPLLTWPGASTVEPEPIASLEAARELERAAHSLAADYIRLARETGRSWYEIGDALNLHAFASANKLPIAEEAYGYALRNHRGPGRPTFTWTCPACLLTITDHGPYPDPPNREEGHGASCPRQAAQLAAQERRSR